MGDLTISGVTSKAYFVPQGHWIFMAIQAGWSGWTEDKMGDSRQSTFLFSREWTRELYSKTEGGSNPVLG